MRIVDLYRTCNNLVGTTLVRVYQEKDGQMFRVYYGKFCNVPLWIMDAEVNTFDFDIDLTGVLICVND